MSTDRELLDRHVADASGPAFAELVDRHSRMVFATCLRILGDEHSAQDAAQAAFLLLARNAKRLPRAAVLSGWMHLTARNCARHLKRSQVRRRRHEAEASLMRAHDKPDPSWERARPEMDAALVALPARQRQAVVLRYLSGRSYAEGAGEMRCAEATFKAHLSAGLTRLRAKLARSGAALSGAALAAHLGAQAEIELPAGLASSIAAVCSGSAAASPTVLATMSGAARAVVWAKLKLAAVVLSATAATAGVAAVGAAALSGGRSYYVAPSGAAGSPGTLEKPFKHPIEAAAFLEPGDTLYFRAGTYRCRTDRLVGLAPARSGRPGRPISFKAHPGERAVVDCTGSDWGFTPNGRSHIAIDGFEIRNDTGYGVKISASSDGDRTGSHVTVRNCRVLDTQKECVFAWETPHVRVENCLTSGSRTSHGVSIQNGCRGAAVRRVTSEGNALNGIKVRGSEGVLVERCLLRDNGRGLEVGGAQGCTFRGNVFFGNAWRGPLDSSHYEILMEGGGKDVTDPACRDNLFEANTVANPGGAGRRLRRLVQVNAGCTETTFRNNILYARGVPVFGFYGDCLQGHVFEDNCLFSTTGQQVYVSGGVGVLTLSDFAARYKMKASGNAFGDPLFADVENGNLQLKPGSPARGRGAALPAGCSLPERAAPPKR